MWPQNDLIFFATVRLKTMQPLLSFRSHSQTLSYNYLIPLPFTIFLPPILLTHSTFNNNSHTQTPLLSLLDSCAFRIFSPIILPASFLTLPPHNPNPLGSSRDRFFHHQLPTSHTYYFYYFAKCWSRPPPTRLFFALPFSGFWIFISCLLLLHDLFHLSFNRFFSRFGLYLFAFAFFIFIFHFLYNFERGLEFDFRFCFVFRARGRWRKINREKYVWILLFADFLSSFSF